MKKVINSIAKYFSEDAFTKSILLVSGGAAVSQVVKIIAQPIITRIYSPEEYGILSLYLSIISLLQFSTLRYEVAIPIAKDDSEAKNLLALSFSFLISMTLLMMALLTFSGSTILSWIDSEALYSNRFLLPIGLFFNGTSLILTEWIYRKQNYRVITYKQVSQSLIANFLKIFFGWLKKASSGLIVGQIAGDGLSTLPIISLLRNDLKGTNKITSKSLKNTARKFKAFPLFQTPSSFAIHGRDQIPVIFLTSIFGAGVAGYYGLANSIIKLPMTIIGQSVMKVFYSEIGAIGNENPQKVKDLSIKLFKQLSSIIILPMIILFILGPRLVSFIFGEDWTQAGVFIQILTIYVLPDFVLSPISRVFELFDKQHIKMFIDICSLIIISLFYLFISVLEINVYITLIIYSILMLIVSITTFSVSIFIINKKIQEQ